MLPLRATPKTIALLALAAGALAGLLPRDAAAQGAGIQFAPAPVIWIGMDRSASLDFTYDEGAVPGHVLDAAACDPNVEYERNRRILLTEGFTGRFDGLCAIGEPRSGGALDAVLPWPHIAYTWTRHRDGGLLQMGAPFVNFGYGSFDSIEDTGTGQAGGYSLGAEYNGINLGISNRADQSGGYVPPLPWQGYPPRDGVHRAWRQHIASEAYERILDIHPMGGTPLAATLEDIEFLRHHDPGVVNDPYNSCRAHAALLVTDGGDTWEICSSDPTNAAPELNCDDYDYALANVVAERLAGETSCRSCTGGETVYPVPTYVVGVNVDEPLAVDQLEGIAEGGGTCAVLAEDGTCVQHSFRANDYHALVNSLATVLNSVVGGTQSAVQPQTMRLSYNGRPGIATFTAGAVFGDSAWASGTFQRTHYYCAFDEDDPDAPGFLAEAPTIDLTEQFTPARAAAASVPIFTNRLDLQSSCARPTCDFHDPVACGDVAGWVPDPETGIGNGTGGLQRGGANPTAAAPEQDAALELLMGVPNGGVVGGDGSGIDPDDIGEMAVCDPDATTRIVTASEGQYLVANEGFTEGPCAGDAVVCHTAPDPDQTLRIIASALTGHLGHGDTLGVCYPPAAAGTTVCHRRLLLLPETLELTNEEAAFHLTYHLTDTAGPCSPEPDAYTREEIENALHSERQRDFWNGNDFELFEDTSLAFDTVATDCMVPLEVGTWRDHPDYFAAENPDHVEAIIRWTHGENLADLAALLPSEFDPATAPFYDRPADDYFGDVLHGQMAIAGRPNLLVRTTEGYQNFVNDHGARRRMVYLPNNSGQLMAFDAESGEHLWSFVPGSMLPALAQTMHARRPILDGPVVLEDMICGYDAAGTDEYCTILAMSYGAGGSGVSVLDVSDPEAPKFLFELTGQDVPELGIGGPRALLTQLEINDGTTQRARGVLAITGGAPGGGAEAVLGGDRIGGTSGEVFLVMELPSGRILRQFDATTDPDLFAECGAVTSPPETLSIFSTGAGIYAGTQYGCLLFLDTSSPYPANWTLNVIDKASTPGMILYPPAVARRADGSNIIVYSQGSPEFDPHHGRVQTLVSFRHALELVSSADGTPDRYSFAATDLSTRDNVNFELAFEPGEVVTAEPVIADGVIYFATWYPNSTPCEFGSARLWGVGYLGNRNEPGPVSARPYVARAGDARITPMLPNPDFAFDDALPAIVPFITSLQLIEADPSARPTSDYSVIYDVNINTVPSCDAVDARVSHDGANAEVLSGSSHRELSVHMIRTDSLDTSSGWSAAANSVDTVAIPFELRDASASGFPLDWGSIRLY
jgi:hypothetical protein